MTEQKNFTINSYISLILDEDGKTKICINDEEFIICKSLIASFNKDSLQNIKTIDELYDISRKTLNKKDINVYQINPLDEFWAHCSNLQAWAENGYDTRLLHRNIAFPLLKRLTEVGDNTAKKVFKEEISKRYVLGAWDTKYYLEFEGFLDLVSQEEIIINGLEFEEGNLLLDILSLMKTFDIKYEMVRDFDEDRVRHRFRNHRFLTIYDGHVREIEFDLCNDSVKLFENLYYLKKVRSLTLIIKEIKNKEYIMRRKLESLKFLQIYNLTSTQIPNNIFYNFPNLKILRINKYKEKTENVLLDLKKKGVRISNLYNPKWKD